MKQRQETKISLSLPFPLVRREKMPFHHVTAGLLYKGNYLNRSLSAGSDSEQLANISVEELDGERRPRGFSKGGWEWGKVRFHLVWSVVMR